MHNMLKITEQVLAKSQYDYISSDTLKLISGKSGDSFYGSVKRALAAKELIRISRGLYLLGEKYRRRKISDKVLSCHIYQPSYLSFEYALSFHGFIPDIVQRTLSASAIRSKTFKTPIGSFEYFHIPIHPFFIGVERRVDKSNEGFLIASPERAICDLIYKRKLKWHGLVELREAFRLDEDALVKLDIGLLKDISNNFTKRVKQYINKFVRSLKSEL